MFSEIRTLQIYCQGNKRKKPKKLWRQAQGINKVIFSSFSDSNRLLNWSLLMMEYILTQKYQQQITTASVYINAPSKHVCRPTLSKFHAWILNTVAKNVHFLCSYQFLGLLSSFLSFTFLLYAIAVQWEKVQWEEGEKERERSNEFLWLAYFTCVQRGFLVNLACKVLSLVSIQRGMS